MLKSLKELIRKNNEYKLADVNPKNECHNIKLTEIVDIGIYV